MAGSSAAEDALALLERFADGKAADREARKAMPLEPFERGEPERRVHAALDDAEQHALAGLRSKARRLRYDQRSDSSMDSRASLFGRGVRRALVEHHRHVRAERALDLHRALGVQEHFRAVDRASGSGRPPP